MTLQELYQSKRAREYTHKCSYCNETTITLRLEEVTKGRTKQYKYVARNKETGDIHNCIAGRY